MKQYKKSELMLMRRARAYSSSCFHISIHFVAIHCALLQPKFAKKSLKTPFWKFRIIQGLRCWYH